MNSTPLMSSTIAVLPPSITAVSRSANCGAVVTWISPRTLMTHAPPSELSSESSKWGTTGDTGPLSHRGAERAEPVLAAGSGRATGRSRIVSYVTSDDDKDLTI